jgi:hypothetical protein
MRRSRHPIILFFLKTIAWALYQIEYQPFGISSNGGLGLRDTAINKDKIESGGREAESGRRFRQGE